VGERGCRGDEIKALAISTFIVSRLRLGQKKSRVNLSHTVVEGGYVDPSLKRELFAPKPQRFAAPGKTKV
jgi:hypothetical protein